MAHEGYPSFFFELWSQYKRIDWTIVDAVGHDNDIAKQIASDCLRYVHLRPPEKTDIVSTISGYRLEPATTEISLWICHDEYYCRPLLVWEKKCDGFVAGVVFGGFNWRIREQLAHILLRQEWATTYLPDFIQSETSSNQAVAICRLFEKDLLYRIPNIDQWAQVGKEQFRKSVEYFVARGLSIRFALTMSLYKRIDTSKGAPDGIEYESLETLRQFNDNVRKIYRPGCRVDIMGFGHATADCKAVSDTTVTRYNNLLKQMAHTGFVRRNHYFIAGRLVSVGTLHDFIHFHSLRSVLQPAVDRKRFEQSYPDVHHPLLNEEFDIKLETLDEESRAILLGACRYSTEGLKAVLRYNPNPTLRTQFMRTCEEIHADVIPKLGPRLQTNPIQGLLLAEQAGYEFASRETAYLRLVDLITPRHIQLTVRLSSNKGTSFAVRLLPRDTFRAHTDFPVRPQGNTENIVKLFNNLAEDNDTYHRLLSKGVLVNIRGVRKTMLCKPKKVDEELSREDTP